MQSVFNWDSSYNKESIILHKGCVMKLRKNSSRLVNAYSAGSSHFKRVRSVPTICPHSNALIVQKKKGMFQPSGPQPPGSATTYINISWISHTNLILSFIQILSCFSEHVLEIKIRRHFGHCIDYG